MTKRKPNLRKKSKGSSKRGGRVGEIPSKLDTSQLDTSQLDTSVPTSSTGASTSPDASTSTGASTSIGAYTPDSDVNYVKPRFENNVLNWIYNNPIKIGIFCLIVVCIILCILYAKQIGDFLWASNMGINIGGSEKDDKDDKD